MGGAVLILGIAVMLVCLKIFVIDNKSGKKKLRDRAKANGWIATAVCVKSRSAIGDKRYKADGEVDFDHNAVKATYEYVVKGRTYRKKYKFLDPGSFSTAAPYRLELYYDANHPRRAVTSGEVEAHRQTGCLWTVLLTVGSMFLFTRLLIFIFGT